MDGDPRLYIHFYNDLYTEYEPSEIEAINSYFEHPPSVAIVAYVSGRHIDNHPEYNFVNLFMSRYKSIADDCLSNHLWTLDEINSGYLVDGHPFFDVLGHYLDFKASNRGLNYRNRKILTVIYNQVKTRFAACRWMGWKK